MEIRRAQVSAGPAVRLTCPACQAETSLEALVGREADARAFAAFAQRHVPLGAALVQYVAMFRPAKRRLSLARSMALLDELLADIERGAITRKGRDWPVSHDQWRAAIDHMLALRDKGNLTLPLTSHGYLLEVLAGMADKAEAVAERDTEAARRQRAGAAATTTADGPLQAATAMAAAAPAPAPPPYDMSKGPSRAARELRARMAAAQLARSQGLDPDASTDAGADPS